MLYSACPEQEMQILLAVVTFLSECVVQHASFMLLALGQHSPQWVGIMSTRIKLFFPKYFEQIFRAPFVPVWCVAVWWSRMQSLQPNYSMIWPCSPKNTWVWGLFFFLRGRVLFVCFVCFVMLGGFSVSCLLWFCVWGFLCAEGYYYLFGFKCLFLVLNITIQVPHVVIMNVSRGDMNSSLVFQSQTWMLLVHAMLSSDT